MYIQRLASGKPHNRGGSTKSCYRCGKSGHRCFYRHQKCRACQEKGVRTREHPTELRNSGTQSPGGSPFDRVNKNKAAGNKKFRSAGYVDIESGEQSEDNGSEDTQLFAISEPRYSPMVVKPTVDGVELKMELDTGATVSLASERVWKEVFKKCPLEKCQTLLRTNTGERLPVLGQLNVTVEYEDQKAELPLLIVPGDGPALWGRNWFSAIRLNWQAIKYVTQGIESILSRYPDLFKEELGTLKGMEIKLSIAKDAVPRF